MVHYNPFTPSFGEIPLVLAGRDGLLSDVEYSLNAQSRSPELTLLLSGARGTGKTALLAWIAEYAQELGWISINVTAGSEMLDEIYVRLVRASEHLISAQNTKQLTGLGVAQVFKLEWNNQDPEYATWREQVEDVLVKLNEIGVGVLITVDEVLPDLPEMVRLASVYQHFIRERRKVSLMMAGLPFNIDSLLRDKTVSFLRRAQRYPVGRVADYAVRDAVLKTVQHGGRTIDDDALAHITAAVDGFPYMIQLSGYRTWNQNPDEECITYDDAVAGCELAAHELRERVLYSTYRELSDGDIAFLSTMLADEGDTRLKDIEQRLGKSSGYVNTYRRRLLASGVIGERRRGVVGFDLPGFRKFLSEELGR